MLKNLKKGSSFSLAYRLVVNGEVKNIRHTELMAQDQKHIIVCIENIDAEVMAELALNEEQKKTNLAELDKMIDISKCHSMAYRYPTIKKWFLREYPEIAKFGIVETEAQNNCQQEEQAEESKSQNAVPASEVPCFNDVQTPAVNVLQ
jgi:hypothetical protein